MPPWIAPRTVQRLDENTGNADTPANTYIASHPLADFREQPAWVLLGEPGAGKSVALQQEADAVGGLYLPISEFLCDDIDPAWKGRTLFLDGLDESRAGGGDRHLLQQLAAKLRRLERPRFRLSCRAADWLGASDRDILNRVAPGGSVQVLLLDPLADTAVLDILQRNHQVADAEAFINQAEHNELQALLHNPQTLDLLARAWQGGNWPDSRQQIYELACRKLAEEPSKIHRDARRDKPVDSGALLDAAGQLCAVLLLADQSGLALDVGQADARHPSLETLLPPQPEYAGLAVRSMLFRATAHGEEQMEAAHRSIAEFLAARWLAQQVDRNGLPLSRLLRLLQGRDGRTVAGLRGLYAWLSLHSPTLRPQLMGADPLTVLLYGDVKPMPAADKRELLRHFRREAENLATLRREISPSSALGALIDRELILDILEILKDSARDDASQNFLDFILDCLQSTPERTAFLEALYRLITDTTQRPTVRYRALEAWLLDVDRFPQTAISLLESIHTALPDNSSRELANLLLRKLYPAYLSPEQLLQFFLPQTEKYFSSLDSYSWFWEYDFPELAPKTHLPILLDLLLQRSDLNCINPAQHSVKGMLSRLLRRCVEHYGDEVSDDRLYSWLGVGASPHGQVKRQSEDQQFISDWLEQRPERYKGLLKLCYDHAEPNSSTNSLFARCHRLHGARFPEDLGLWHLQQATLGGNTHTACAHLHAAAGLLVSGTGCEGLTLEQLESWAGNDPERCQQLTASLSDPISESHWEEVLDDKEFIQQRAQIQTQRNQYLLSHESAIRSGESPPALLYELAAVWLDHFSGAHGKTLPERFSRYCADPEKIQSAAAEGFYAAPLRTDLPDVANIIELSLEQRYSFLLHPCLIGMDLRWERGREEVTGLTDDCLQRMLAFHLSWPCNSNAQWVSYLVRERAELVAEVYLAHARARLKTGHQKLAFCFEFASSKAFDALAARVLPELLRIFPTRISGFHTESLRLLLLAAIRIALPELDGLIQEKLSVPRMDACQKIYWLATATQLAPQTYESRLWRHVGQSWQRAQHLSRYLERLPDDSRLALSPQGYGRLIQLLLPHADMEWRSGEVTTASALGDAIRALITRLANLANDAADAELQRLRQQPALHKLRFLLDDALYQLHSQRREASFAFLSPAKVAAVLANREPANPADLAALVLAHLEGLGNSLRQDNDDGFRQFWNVESGKTRGKREENHCRDYLLGQLRLRLQTFGLDCQPEADYARDKRADLRISFRNQFALPIELKRDDNRDLWRGLRRQLVEQYCRAPDTGGYGIYLVLWFGCNDQAQVGDGGRKATSPAELQERLAATLNPEEKQRIAIRVLDVSWPQNQSR